MLRKMCYSRWKQHWTREGGCFDEFGRRVFCSYTVCSFYHFLQLDSVKWRLNLQMAQANQAKMKLPNAMFELNLSTGQVGSAPRPWAGSGTNMRSAAFPQAKRPCRNSVDLHFILGPTHVCDRSADLREIDCVSGRVNSFPPTICFDSLIASHSQNWLITLTRLFYIDWGFVVGTVNRYKSRVCRPGNI